MRFMKSERHTGIFFMALTAVMWSTAGLFIKSVPWNPFVIAGFRSLISSCVILSYMFFSKIKVHITKKSVITGITLAATFLTFVSANKLTKSANAIALQFVAPIFIMMIESLIFKQRFRKADILTSFITIIGISLFFFDELSGGNLLGNIIALFSGLCIASMYVATYKCDMKERMNGIFLGNIFTAIVGMPFCLFFDTPVTQAAVINIILLGVIQLGLSYVTYGIAAKSCPPLLCSLVAAIEPVLNPVWVFLFVGERPGFFALAGGIIVVATVTAWCVWSDKQAKSMPQP